MRYVLAIPLGTAALMGIVACSSPEATTEGPDSLTTEDSLPAAFPEPNEQESPALDAEAIAPGTEPISDAELVETIQANLDAQLPDNQLTVEAEQGAVVVMGEVATTEELQQAEAIAIATRGVQSVEMQVEMAMPTS